MKHKRTAWLYCRIDPKMKRSLRKAADQLRLSFADYIIQLHLAEEKRKEKD